MSDQRDPLVDPKQGDWIGGVYGLGDVEEDGARYMRRTDGGAVRP